MEKHARYPLIGRQVVGILVYSPLMSRKKKPGAVRVGRSSAGLGLFAAQDFKKGDFIIEYTGERISDDEANRRGGRYLFTYSKQITIDGKGRKNIARYINHACRPNAEAELDENDEAIYIYAKKNIKTGEEITYHYGREYWNDIIKPEGCRCEKCADIKE